MNLHVSPQRATDNLLTQANLRLRIGEHVIDVGALRIVTRPDFPRLTSKAVAVLIELVRHVGATVTRDQLLDRVWTGRFPTPDVLTQAIKELRRAFADDSKPPQYIETIPKVGYRLVASVLVLDGPDRGVFVEGSAAQSLDTGDDNGEESAEAMSAPPARASGGRKWRIPALLAAAVAIGCAVLAARTFMPRATKDATWQVSDLHALTSDPGAEYRPNLSPDGSRAVYSIFDKQGAVERLVVRSVDSSAQVFLTNGSTTIEGLPVWSPDGTRVVFERLGAGYCEMFVASGVGGGEREVGTCKDFNTNYYDWTPDGRSLTISERLNGDRDNIALFNLNLDTGEKSQLQYPRGIDDQDLDPHYSPDGRWLAFRRGVAPYSDFMVMAAAGGTPRQVTHLSTRIRGYTWTSDSRSLIFSSDYKGPSALYTIDIDSGQIEPLGISPAQYPNASRTGDAVVYEITRTQDKLKSMPLTEGAAPRVLAPSTGSDFTPVLSPSGDNVVFVSDRSGQLQLWLHDLATAATTQLTDQPDIAVFSPRWRTDGKQMLAVRRGAAGRELVEIELANHRQHLLSKPGENIMFGAYGMEPERYLVAIRHPGGSSELLQIDHPATAQEARKTLATGIAYGHVDPTTRSIYYTKTTVDGLFRLDLDNGSEHFVTAKISSALMNGWRVVDGRIWYLADFGIRTEVMREFDPASDKDREVARLNMVLQDISFSVMPSHDAIIFAPVDIEDTDIGMFRLKRTRGS